MAGEYSLSIALGRISPGDEGGAVKRPSQCSAVVALITRDCVLEMHGEQGSHIRLYRLCPEQFHGASFMWNSARAALIVENPVQS